jgi:ribosomal protein S27E
MTTTHLQIDATPAVPDNIITDGETSYEPNDMRNPVFQGHFCTAEMKLSSRSPFDVECQDCGTMRSYPNGGGKYRIVIKAGTTLGEISGIAPVYAA